MIVDMLPTEEQTLVADSVRGLLERSLPVERLHDTASYGGVRERAVWNDLCDLGLFGLGLADVRGGIGYSPVEEAIVAREFGRHLISPSVVATMLAVHIAASAGDRPLVEAFVRGSRRAAFGNVLDPLDRHSVEAQLIDADASDYFLLSDANSCALVAATSAINLRRVPSIDDAVTVDRAALELASVVQAGSDIVQQISLTLAAYLVGIASATRDMAVEYAKIREQFGQPIGAFQAIKHSCADMVVREEAAYAQTFFAMVARQSSSGGLALDAASAHLLATHAAIENAKANIQVHGAMGFTFECDAHLYLKRANLLAVLNGSARQDQVAILA